MANGTRCVLCSAVNCGSSLGNRAYAYGTPSYPTERSKTQLMCSSGFVWTTGESGTTVKTATCNDIGSGYGSWITNGDCVGQLRVQCIRTRTHTHMQSIGFPERHTTQNVEMCDVT